MQTETKGEIECYSSLISYLDELIGAELQALELARHLKITPPKQGPC